MESLRSASALASVSDFRMLVAPGIHGLDPSEIQYSEKKVKRVGPYVMGRVLGEGSYGKVKEAVHSVTLRRVAIKIIRVRHLKKIPSGEEKQVFFPFF